ncbi:helix-turn-helix domain-containing protein [Microvirga sp. STR05]|uniref:Helix-turn-helix domain-containing protein n=1 Tax=Hymenobacter duratus TaxID=2771356 RepID=A0ABR8JKI6_9BACT|nr:helix-turn-helix domain-containing protein [Hymenobacter duratus]MBD2716073.1 helix-turn-helix domain-containing protein [Hymenobacter duratus]MBR7950987.1 helix-turn-helix domain-containing protein [Microvirga sp. STR05]
MEIILLTPEQLSILIAEAIATAVAPTAATDAILTVKETAKRLKRSEKFIRDEIQRGRLKADNSNHKVSGTRASWRVRESDISAYLKRLR